MSQSRSNPRRANGNQRNKVRAQVLREENLCALCGQPVDKTLTIVIGSHGKKCRGNCVGCTPHPMRAEVDEIVRVRDGGDPLNRANCRLTHRHCNRYRDVKHKSAAPLIKRARTY